MSDFEEVKVEIGSHQRVEIDKLFGSMIFMGLRITPSPERCEWIIERQTMLPCPDPEDKQFTDCWNTWVEWCRIPGQFDWEFRKDS